LLVCSLLYATLGRAAGNDTDLVCRPFGTCEPCPADALNEPFCQPFGNRRLMHCAPASAPSPSPPTPDAPNPDPDTPPPPPHEPGTAHRPAPDSEARPGEIPAWESCGRIVQKERADFYEFFACNFAIALVALVVLFARSKRLQAMHARQLAARIGLVRGIPGGWANG
ncbi:uncharacterized protein LAESUDRAFT_645045, partial [Laetiporus sulphureus 93-53]